MYYVYFLTQQYFFSDASLYFLCDELKRLEYCRVLCIGTPRYSCGLNILTPVHYSDYLCRLHSLLKKGGEIRSLLLDIDHRYVSVTVQMWV